MRASKITDVNLDKRRVYITLGSEGTINLPRREGGYLLRDIGCYDNGKWTAIDVYKKLIGRYLAEHGSEVWIYKKTNKNKGNHTIEPAKQDGTIDDKVLIIGNEILPPGKGEERGESCGLNPKSEPDVDTGEYKEAMKELGIIAVKIYQRDKTKDFLGQRNYKVYETSSGKFIAVSPEPKNAVYVTKDLETLLTDKQTVIKDNKAQRIWRQGAWRDRVREIAY